MVREGIALVHTVCRTKKRVEDGLYWLTKAANEGSASAQYSLGNIYREGLEGITIDLEKAESWYLKAMNNDDEKIASKAKEGMRLLQTLSPKALYSHNQGTY